MYDKADTAWLFHGRSSRWYVIYEAACGILRLEVVVFLVVYLACQEVIREARYDFLTKDRSFVCTTD